MVWCCGCVVCGVVLWVGGAQVRGTHTTQTQLREEAQRCHCTSKAFPTPTVTSPLTHRSNTKGILLLLHFDVFCDALVVGALHTYTTRQLELAAVSGKQRQLIHAHNYSPSPGPLSSPSWPASCSQRIPFGPPDTALAARRLLLP